MKSALDDKFGMIELELKIHKERIEPSEFTKKFTLPIIFYLRHKKDNFWGLFYTFEIVDFKKGQITYLTTYSPENIKKFEEHPLSQKLDLKKQHVPHCSFEIIPGQSFYSFIYRECNFFYKIDAKNKTFKIITNEALKIENNSKITSFGDTFYKSFTNPKEFYFLAKTNENEGYNLNYYKTDLDFNKIEKIYGSHSKKPFGNPHSIRNYQHYLLITEFLCTKLKLESTGKIFENPTEFLRFIISEEYKKLDLFSKFYNLLKSNVQSAIHKTKDYTLKQLNELRTNKTTMNSYKKKMFHTNNPLEKYNMEEAYFESVSSQKRFSSFLKITEYAKKEGYSFKIIPGIIRLFNLETKSEKTFNTSVAGPGHIEIDESENEIYISNHNMDFLHQGGIFLGNASIDKFKLEKDQLKLVNKFTAEKFYRITTHRICKYKGKTYIVTVGQPNKICIIDADTMELYHSEDIGQNILDPMDDPQELFSCEQFKIPTLEISEDGSRIFLLSYQGYMYIYGLPERKVLQKIPVIKPLKISENLNLKDFVISTAHSNSL